METKPRNLSCVQWCLCVTPMQVPGLLLNVEALAWRGHEDHWHTYSSHEVFHYIHYVE